MTSNDQEDSTPLKDMKTFEKWRQSLQYITGLGMTPQEEQNFKKKLDQNLEEYQCKTCEIWKENLLKNSPPVRFMVDELEKIGTKVTKEDFTCVPCDPTRSGGFSPEGIILCQNTLPEKTMQETTMVHEMVHLYDDTKFKVDWTNLKHQACSEIRASSLSGDCRWTREMKRGFFTFTKQHQACVKRRAILSVEQNPLCESREDAERAVQSVFDSCFADTRPFDEIY
ncbi:peptidase M76 family-domain-containing protein [Sporodiniella umbellata]|nr:peptidase M76 family-domain-containing protein [Sporodiniella umbellata]